MVSKSKGTPRAADALAGDASDNISKKSIPTTSTTAAAAAAVSNKKQQADAMVMFPRGGQPLLTPLELKNIQESVSNEVKNIDVIDLDIGGGDGGGETVTARQTKRKKFVKEDDSPHSSSSNINKRKKTGNNGGDGTNGESSERQKSMTSNVKDVEGLTFKKLSVGMTLMGLVKEINDLDLVISLPNQQTGFVSITDISDYITAQVEAAAGDMENDDDEENTTGAADKDDQETEVPNLSDFFTVGQLLTCAISALQTGSPSAPSSNSNNGKNSNNNAAAPSSSTKRRIELSLKPEHVNAALSVTDLYSGMPLVGSVVSKEDHGYIINLGITDTSGFLKASSSSMDLKLGQLVGVVVKDTPKSTTQRTIHLTFTSLTPSTPLQLPPTASITSIQPGQLLPAKIKSVLAHGLVLGLQDGLIEGTVHVFHTDIVGQLHSGKTMDDFFRVGDRIKAARVVHVDSAKKRIGLSLRQSVLPTDNENDDVSLADTTASSFPSSWNLRVGDGKEVDVGSRLTLKVVEADSDKGLVLVDESGDLVAFAHKSQIFDSQFVKFDRKHREGTLHQARVISLSPFDQVLSVSLQPSVLKQAFIRYNDLKPGMPVKATVTRLVNNGILLSVSDNINGFVPKLHMSDVTLSNPGKMFKAGTTMVKGHVLSCDPSQRRLIITLRKTLVNSTLAKITSYEEAKPGLLSSGVITSVTDFGCFVAFYNGVKGFAHISELSDEFITKPSQHFKVGQTVKIRVVSGVEDGNKLKISFKLNIGSTSATTAHHLTHSIALGHLVSAKLMSKSASSFVLELSNGQSSEDPSSSTLTATMDVAHLSDVKDPAHLTKLVASAFKEGQVIHDCLVIGIDMKRKAVRLSIKPCLVAMAKEGRLVTSMDAVQVGMVVPGFVQKLLPSGCIVGLVGGMFGLAKLHTISDRFITAIGDHISEGQTVLATVTEIDDVTRRFTVNLKNSVNFPSELGVAPSRYEAAYLESMFGELDAVFLHNNVSINTANLWCAGLCIGSLVEGSVKQVLPYGYIIDVNGKHSSGISGLVTTYQGVGKGLVEGSSVKARIMDIDLQKKIIDLSLSHTEVVEKSHEQILDSRDKMAPVEAIVEIIKEDYLIVSLPTMSHSIAFVAVKTFNSLESAFSRFKEGQKIKIVLTKASTATPPSPLPHPSKKSSKKSSSKHQPAGIPASFQGLLEQRNIGVLRQDAAPLAKQKSTAAGNNGSPFSSGTSSNNNRKSNTLKDPFDSTLTSLDDVTPGRLVKVRVKSIKSNQINVEIAANLMGRIHICEFVDCLEDLNDIKSPFKNIKNDDIIEAKVVGFHDVKTHDALAISRKSTVSSLTVDLTTRKSDLSAANGSLALSLEDSDACRHAQFEKLEQNDIVLGFIQTVMNDAVWIYLSPSLMGRAYILECSTSLSALQNIKEHFVAGQAVKCRVISKDQEKKSLDLSLLLADEDYGKIETGKLVVGRVSKVSPESGLLVQLPSRLMGRVHLTNISDTYVKDPTAGFVKGQLVQCYVVHSCIDEAKNQHQIDLSLRESRVGAVSTSTGGDDAELSSIASIEADMVVQGYVKNTSENGCFVALSPSLTARVKIADLSDSFIKDWKPQFPVGKLVKGKIMSVDQRTNRIEFSLKLSVIDPAAAAAAQDQASAGEDGGLKFEDLIQGLKVKGAITKVEKYGVFIKLHNSKVSGLCHISEISDEEITSIDKLFSSGDVVKAFVLAIDKKKKRVNFGLKASYFDDEDAMEVDDCSSEEEEEDRGDHESDSAQEENGSIPDQEDDEESMEEEDDVEVGSGMEVDELPIATSPSAVGSIKSTQDIRSIMSSATPLAIDSDDDAMADAVASDEESVDDAEEEEDKSAVSSGSEVDDDDDYNNNDVSTKKSRRAKKREKQEEEKRTVAKEQMIAAGDAPPETADDFERLLLGSPHSSFLWIQYMAFQIQLTEIEKARQVTERALKTISFKEEKERMNVWVAYMNLENSYGTRDSLIKVFDRAVSTNDPKAVYMQLAQIYIRTEQAQHAQDLYGVMLKKFKQSSKVWVAAGLFHLQKGALDKAREILQASLKSLPKHKHVKTITKFAQMEYKHGEPERGRTIFEGIISNYPKRVDLWNVYLDQEIKIGQQSVIRRLFERVISMKFSSKKMKFFFKKYLDFEKQHGDESGVDHVKQAALSYVESLNN